MHHSIACMLKFFILLFQGLTILWCISFFNLAFEFLETHAKDDLFSIKLHNHKRCGLSVYFYTCMHFDSCCVLDHQLLEFYMLKFIDLQKHFHMSCQHVPRLCLLLFVHRMRELSRRERTVLSLVV
ncbi:hypothetical protein NC653_026672 [Populus alba x Populus x berolinensis]|uniref:Uncharacterized protein n=1 Tax=Populus alba x Populus x berolinensis TaxID=444605 RepID=A0AAD6Q9I5_9ROSI|nr:hypothetical protein NC653_026672 [Populus alba x Populus x berolinensis]